MKDYYTEIDFWFDGTEYRIEIESTSASTLKNANGYTTLNVDEIYKGCDGFIASLSFTLWGQSVCSKKDAFSEWYGAKLALERALNQPHITVSHEFRKAAWAAFWGHYERRYRIVWTNADGELVIGKTIRR